MQGDDTGVAMVSKRHVSTLLATLSTGISDAFIFPFGAKLSSSSSSSTVHSTATSTTVSLTKPPSWDELSNTLAARDSDSNIPSPRVTLYRDTNGWCPFCERVWLVLRAKGIPFDEQLISLQNKPEWYKALVPTTLVPAVLFHESGIDENGEEAKKNERRIVWESSDIIKALDEQFPEHPMLVESPEYDAAIQMNEDLSTAGFQFVYAGRNDTLTDEDKLERKTKFLAQLDRLDAELAEEQRKEGVPCFRLGKEFTAIDAIMIPTLERWRWQLPLTSDIDILEGRPGLKQWFDAMDSYPPYRDRVMGDEYSWTATNSMFLRYFADEDDPKIATAIQRADDAAARITNSFLDVAIQEDDKKMHSKEAAAKLVANHEAIVKDCTSTGEDTKFQKHIDRASNSAAADMMLRFVCKCLLSENNTLEEAKEASLVDMISAKDAAAAARVVASRLCVPRDMSAPAASILRATLATAAN